MTKLTQRRWFTASSLLSFLLGGIIGLAFGFLARRSLVFKNEVLVGDVLNLFSAILIALVLQNAVVRRATNTRAEKDLLLARIATIDVALNETHKLFMRRAQDVNSVTDAAMYAAFKDLSNHLYLLEQALARTKTGITRIELAQLKRARFEYRHRVLGEDFSKGQPYASNVAILEERAFRSIAQELISVAFDINNQ